MNQKIIYIQNEINVRHIFESAAKYLTFDIVIQNSNVTFKHCINQYTLFRYSSCPRAKVHMYGFGCVEKIQQKLKQQQQNRIRNRQQITVNWK